MVGDMGENFFYDEKNRCEGSFFSMNVIIYGVVFVFGLILLLGV